MNPTHNPSQGQFPSTSLPGRPGQKQNDPAQYQCGSFSHVIRAWEAPQVPNSCSRAFVLKRFIPEVSSIFEFDYQDFTLENYDPHPHIPAPVAV